MKHRSVVAVICFSIITFGIYDLFWLASTKKELNARTRVHIPSLWLFFVPILALFALGIVEFVAQLTFRSGTSTSTPAAVNIVSIVVGVAALIGILVVPIVWFLKYSKAVAEYTNNGISTAVAFLLLWLLRFVGIAVIQDHFNDMIAGGSAGGQNPAAAGAMPAVPMDQNTQSGTAQPPVNPVPPAQTGDQPGSQGNPQPPLIQ